MKIIVIATDGSPSAREAIDVGLELASEQSADVTFVHVLPADDYMVLGRGGPVLPKRHHVEIDESETALKDAADAAEAAGISYALERISGDTVDEIIALADAKRATPGRSFSLKGIRKPTGNRVPPSRRRCRSSRGCPAEEHEACQDQQPRGGEPRSAPSRRPPRGGWPWVKS